MHLQNYFNGEALRTESWREKLKTINSHQDSKNTRGKQNLFFDFLSPFASLR